MTGVDELQGVLAYIPTLHATPLWLACAPDADPETISTLLRKAYRELGFRPNLTLEHPNGLHEGALEEGGFYKVRTLIWMYMINAT